MIMIIVMIIEMTRIQNYFKWSGLSSATISRIAIKIQICNKGTVP